MPVRAIIADDEAHLRLYIKTTLRQLGLTDIREAVDGSQAVALYQEEWAEIVILDVNMPNLNGLEALAEIRSVNPRAKVIMLTSVAARATVEESVRTGASGYLRKDLPPEELARHLSTLFERLGLKPDPVNRP